MGESGRGAGSFGEMERGVVVMLLVVWESGMRVCQMSLVSLYIGSSSLSGVEIVLFEQFWCMYILVIDPTVIRVWISLPVDKVL